MEVLPSLARASVARSFDPTIWPEGTAMDGDDVLIAGTPCAALADGGPSPYPVVVTRVTRLVRSGPVVVCDVAGPVPAHCALADVAWPGVRLAGATMRQLLVRGADGTRLAARVEVPADVPYDAVIALAMAVPDVRFARLAPWTISAMWQASTGTRQPAAACAPTCCFDPTPSTPVPSTPGGWPHSA